MKQSDCGNLVESTRTELDRATEESSAIEGAAIAAACQNARIVRPTAAQEPNLKKPGMGSHQSASMRKDEWLTPPTIIEALGPFDLDPCSPVVRPWPTARQHYTIEQDGLAQPWRGRIWLNPPYGEQTGKWLEKLRLHGNGIALVFARTETSVWFDHIWGHADAVLFIRGRIYFHHVTGERAHFNSGAPSALVAYAALKRAVARPQRN